jgi:PEP-CTERM motif
MFARNAFIGVFVSGALVTSASAAGISADFSSGSQGFFIGGDGLLEYVVSGGNGYLSVKDTSGDTDVYLNAPIAAGGEDWLVYLGGTLSFDAIMLNGIPPSWPGFGTVTFTSTNGQTAFADLAPDVGGVITEPGTTWKTYSATLSNAVFSQGNAPLSTVLGSLAGVSFSMEAGSGPVEVVGFDNFKVTPAVPEPETWVLSALGLMALGVASRKRPA